MNNADYLRLFHDLESVIMQAIDYAESSFQNNGYIEKSTIDRLRAAELTLSTLRGDSAIFDNTRPKDITHDQQSEMYRIEDLIDAKIRELENKSKTVTTPYGNGADVSENKNRFPVQTEPPNIVDKYAQHENAIFDYMSSADSNFQIVEPIMGYYDDVDISRLSEAVIAYIDTGSGPPTVLDGDKRLKQIFGEQDYMPYMGVVNKIVDASLTPDGINKVKEIFTTVSEEAISRLQKYADFMNEKH